MARNKARHVRHYESYEAICQAAKANVDSAQGNGSRKEAREHCHLLIDDECWRGRAWPNEKEFWDSLQRPWEEGVKIFEELKSSVNLPRPTGRRRKRRWREDEGDDVCPDRLNLGQPYWQGMRHVERPGSPIIRIMTDVSTSAGRNHSEVLWRGVTALVLTDRLEEAGFRVQLDAFNHVERGFKDNAGFLVSYNLKQPHMPLNENLLVNGIAGWFFRTVVFASYFSADLPTPYGSLGSPRTLRDDDYDQFEVDLVIDEIFDREGAINVINETLERFLV